jgi:leishmanolysin-like peptidase
MIIILGFFARNYSSMKQWKRYGAGCYEYKCDEGRVHIVVRNATLVCEKEGQEIQVRLNKGKWLHEGKKKEYY